MTRLRVLAEPEKGILNPHLDLLYGAIRDRGVDVVGFDWRAALLRPVSVIHFHWPEREFPARHRTSRRRLLRALVTLAVIRFARLRGARLVWTAHNLQHHDDPPGSPPSWLMQRFLGQVDGIIHLSETGRSQCARRLPRLASVATNVVPTGSYREAYPDAVSRREARANLDLDADAVVLCSFGRIQRYKGLGALVNAFTELPDNDITLLVVGGGRADLSTMLREAASTDDRVRLTLRRVEPDELQVFLAASDLVVLPYTDILHSGAARLAWTFAIPVLAPAVGAFPEWQAKFGAHWVRLYDGPLTADVLARHVGALRTADSSPPNPPQLPAWPDIARQTIEFYLSLGARTRERVEA